MIDNFKKWAMGNYLQIAFLNVFLMVLVMLRSAGYFAPYFLLSINFIVMISLILSIILFKLNSRTMFVIALIFLLFATFIRLFTVEIWAERTTIYSYQALITATILLIYESFTLKNRIK